MKGITVMGEASFEKEEAAVAVLAYRNVAQKLLEFIVEATNGKPIKFDPEAMRDQLIQEAKGSYSSGASYEMEAKLVEAQIRAIDEFFCTISINGETIKPHGSGKTDE